MEPGPRDELLPTPSSIRWKLRPDLQEQTLFPLSMSPKFIHLRTGPFCESGRISLGVRPFVKTGALGGGLS